MFEDSTFESSGRIKTRSKRWMVATLALNGGVLVALILIPLIYPEALPRLGITTLLEVPPPKQEAPKPIERVRPQNQPISEMQNNTVVAPRRIPPTIKYVDAPEPRGPITLADAVDPSGTPGGMGPNIFNTGVGHPNVKIAGPTTQRVSQGVMEGMLISRVLPVYPPIARASRTQGTVTLQAMISKQGTIENLHVVNGNPMLQQAALDAVSRWRYRPYLLSGEPVEVETTVSVVFKLD